MRTLSEGERTAVAAFFVAVAFVTGLVLMGLAADDPPRKSREQVCAETCGARGVHSLTVWGCTCNRTGLLR